MILGFNHVLKEKADLYKSKKRLTDYALKSKYYLNGIYTDKNDQVVLLIKFVEEKYLLSTLFGNLHFSSLYSFRKMETKNNDKKIGDIFEGIYPCNTKKVNQTLTYDNFPHKFSTPSNDEWNPRPVNLKNGLGFSNRSAKFAGVVSFYTIKASNFDNDSVYDKKFHKKINTKKINQTTLTMMHNFNQEGKVAIVIPMLKDTIMSLKENSLYLDYVTYVDETAPSESLIVNAINKNIWVAAFYKRKSYSEQLEFRIVDKIPNEKGITKHFPGLRQRMFLANEDDLYKLRLNWQ